MLVVQWFKNFRTATKALILVFTMIFLLLVVAFTGYSTNKKIIGTMNSMFIDYVRPAISMGEIKSMAIQNRRLILNMAVINDREQSEGYEKLVVENRKEIADLIERHSGTKTSPEEKKLLDNLQRAGSQLTLKQNEALVAGKLPLTEMPENFLSRLVNNGDIALAEEEYIAIIEKIVDILIDSCEQKNVAANKEGARGTIAVIIASIVATAVGLCMGLYISRAITGPIKKIQDSVNHFAEGNLTHKFPTVGKDELAVMGRGLQNMADNLSRIIGSVQEASNDITSTAQEFSSLAEETNATVEEFRAGVEEMSANLNLLASRGEEVNASVEEVATGAQTTAEKGTAIAGRVDNAMQAGDNGMSSVRRAAEGIEMVAQNASATAKSVQELGKRTRQIQDFVSQIGGIADQTNLLALNAAIEAARAGEAGRGFAVVAEEVRKLAEESNVAAKSIAELASTITGDLDTVVHMSLENAKESDGAKDLSKETEQIIESMLKYLKEISAATQDLAAVSEEQAASSEEIASAVQDISTKVQSTAEAGGKVQIGIADVASSAERIALGSEELTRLADEMNALMEFFKTEASDDVDQKKAVKALPAREKSVSSLNRKGSRFPK
ncbi:MAG: methyl-accepting chemotaxis protein [Synergistaceae bacterium]|nr:methyl-accepting chemotaxis protein [Synergistaceae bacterium]